MVDRIRDYTVIRKLGEGGMGTVYLAADTMLDRNVAIKVLNPEFVEDQAFVARFKQEAKVQSALRHTNIVALHTFFQEDGKYCMVMEYAEGDTLKSVIERTGPLPPDRAVRIMTQILEAVGHAHTTGIIHRDIKPSNIMIGAGDRVKVMDFGIAKILGERGMTRTGAKIGTLYYMSPEQVASPKDLDQRTDIYSLGIVLFEMLTGRLPLDTETESDFELMQQIVDRDVPLVTTVVPDVPARVAEGIRMATLKSRDRRLASCESFRAMLLGASPNTAIPKPAPSSVPLPAPTSPKVGGWLRFFGIALAGFAPLGLLYTSLVTVANLAQINRWPYRTDGSMQVYLILNLLLSGLVTLFSIRAGSAILRKRIDALAKVRTYSSIYLIAGLIGSLLPMLLGRSRISNLPVASSMLLGLAGTVIWYFIVVYYFKKSRRVLDTLGQNLSGAGKTIPPAPLGIPAKPTYSDNAGLSSHFPMTGEGWKSRKNRVFWYFLSILVLGVLMFGLPGASAAAFVVALPVAVLAGVDFLIDAGMLRDQANGERSAGRDVMVGFLAGMTPFILPILFQSPRNPYGTTTVGVFLLAVVYAGGVVGIPLLILRYIDRRKLGPMTGNILDMLPRSTLAGWGKAAAVIAMLATIVTFIAAISSTSISFFSWDDNEPLLYISQIIGAIAVIPIGVRTLQDGKKTWISSSSWVLGGVTVSSVMLIPILLSIVGVFRLGWSSETPFTLSGGTVFNSAFLTSRTAIGIWLLVFVVARIKDPTWPKYFLWIGGGTALLGCMPVFAMLEYWGGAELNYVHGIICPSPWSESVKIFLSLVLHGAAAAFFGALAYRWHAQDKLR